MLNGVAAEAMHESLHDASLGAHILAALQSLTLGAQLGLTVPQCIACACAVMIGQAPVLHLTCVWNTIPRSRPVAPSQSARPACYTIAALARLQVASTYLGGTGQMYLVTRGYPPACDDFRRAF